MRQTLDRLRAATVPVYVVIPQQPRDTQSTVEPDGTIRLLNCGKHADVSKARRELGFAPTSVLDAFTEAYQWFRGRGLVV